jgi:hypothetical protein
MKFVSTLVAVGATAASVNAAISEGQPFGTAGSGFLWIPDEQRYHENPIHVGYGNTIDPFTGMLEQRFPNAPKPDIPFMVPFEDNFYHAPPDMNMWTYTNSPFQPWNNPRSPNYNQRPGEFAYDEFYNTVNLSTGEIFNNNQTPPPQLIAREDGGKFYVLPQSPWMFRGNPLQPYNRPGSSLSKPDETEIPFGYAPNGLQYGYNPFTVNLIDAYIPNVNPFYNRAPLAPIRNYVEPAITPIAVPTQSVPYTNIDGSPTETESN